MYEQIISARDEGQRMDKYLHKLLPNAGTSFLYKMLRKKNITLNDKRAQGSEKLAQGDSIKIFFAQETLDKFMGTGGLESSIQKQRAPGTQSAGIITALEHSIILETEHVLFVNKPAGVLSQKARSEDYSVNDWLLAYLREREHLSEDDIRSFRPCVCNRLDRNTSGLLLCAKSVKGAQFLSDALKQRTMEKHYLALVKGCVKEDMHLIGYLTKDNALNKVAISSEPTDESARIETSYEVLHASEAEAHSLLKVHLITGKPHQIRAHLASIGHPVIGDDKYGDKTINRYYRDKYGIKTQMLHAWQVRFLQGALPGLDIGQTYSAEIPGHFEAFL